MRVLWFSSVKEEYCFYQNLNVNLIETFFYASGLPLFVSQSARFERSHCSKESPKRSCSWGRHRHTSGLEGKGGQEVTATVWRRQRREEEEVTSGSQIARTGTRFSSLSAWCRRDESGWWRHKVCHGEILVIENYAAIVRDCVLWKANYRFNNTFCKSITELFIVGDT